MAQLNAAQKKVVKNYVNSQVLPKDQQYFGSGKFKGGLMYVFLPEEIFEKLEKINYHETLRSDADRLAHDLSAEIAHKKD